MNVCVPDATKGIACVADPISELAKMELVILYNTESFNYNDASKDPVKRESVISYIDFNPNKKYTMKSVIMMANIDENRGLYETSTQDFFTMELGTLTENSNTA